MEEATRQEESSGYQVRLPSFEGPLDLLLHLIKKSEINIYDIPISLITQQYLQYLDLMKALNLQVASEFLVMAATLIHIKSRMLLPPPETPAEEEEEDPRADLVQRLLEYQQFKEAAGRLEERETVWREIFFRQAPSETREIEPHLDLSGVSVFDLLDALQNVLKRTPSPALTMMVDELTVHEQMDWVLDRLRLQNGLLFAELFAGETTRLRVIVTFLALLELIRLKRVRVMQAELFGPIHLWNVES
jgi:segregation and condensation protein A